MSSRSIGTSADLLQCLPGIEPPAPRKPKRVPLKRSPAPSKPREKGTDRPSKWRAYKGSAYRALRQLGGKVRTDHYVSVEAQGELVQCKVMLHLRGRTSREHKRGIIRRFTKGARFRLLCRSRRMDARAPCLFVTLTQLADLSTFGFAEAQRCLQAFRRRLYRRYPKAGVLGRKGLQDRRHAGRIPAVHYHLMLWGCEGFTTEEAYKWWSELVPGYVSPEAIKVIPVQAPDDVHSVSLYVAKYMAKDEVGALDYVSYQAAGDEAGGRWIDKDTGEILAEGAHVDGPEASTGRWWFEWGSQNIPRAVRMVTRVALGDGEWFLRLQSWAHSIWDRVEVGELRGFTLFTKDADLFLLQLVGMGAG